jgi:hypothetical protein
MNPGQALTLAREPLTTENAARICLTPRTTERPSRARKNRCASDIANTAADRYDLCCD